MMCVCRIYWTDSLAGTVRSCDIHGRNVNVFDMAADQMYGLDFYEVSILLSQYGETAHGSLIVYILWQYLYM
jgi:hypothetical protein